jgi:hypothetical protein
MTVIQVRLLVEDVMNPSNDDARQYAIEMISEIFGKEERKEYPRLKLILIEVKHEVR